MSQFYIGVKQVFAYPEENTKGQPGYHVVYRYGQPDAYHSWSPKEEFEKFYLPMGEGAEPTRINEVMAAGFLSDMGTDTKGKTTIVHARLRNGFEIVESSACVDPANYSEEVGKLNCLVKVKNQTWNLLGFVLQWARNGVR